MKYDLKKIMRRAWKIKEKYDQKSKNQLWNHNDFRELKAEETALFSECLKAAWKEAKRASELEKELKIKKEQSERLAKKRNRTFYERIQRSFCILEYMEWDKSF